jgi:hypothetical protein
MANTLLSNFGRKGVDFGLLTIRADIEDTSYLSKYFVISEFSSIFTAGKNVIASMDLRYYRPILKYRFSVLIPMEILYILNLQKAKLNFQMLLISL